MKLRNFVIVVLAILLAFAFVSCKEEQKENPQPTPVASEDIYQMVATKGVNEGWWNYDKFAITVEEEINSGDTIQVKFRSTRDFTKWNIRNGSLKWVYEQSAEYLTSLELGDDGWYTLKYTFGDTWYDGAEVEYPQDLFRLDFIGTIVPGDILEVKDFTLNGEEIEIDEEMVEGYATPTLEIVKDHEWTEAKKYVVLYFTGTPGDVDKTPSYELVAAGGTAVANLTKDGYTLSIYTDEAMETAFDKTTAINADTKLFIKWTALPVTVTFETNGGSAIDAVEIPGGSVLEKPTDPTKDDVVFAGWYSDEDLTKAYDFSAAVTADMTLYAKWVEAMVDITLDPNYTGAPEATKVSTELNAVMEEPAALVRPAYIFAGWYDDAEGTNAHDFTAAVTEAATLYAKWTEGTIYKMVATHGVAEGLYDYDKFTIQYADAKVNAGDVLSFRYRSTTPFTFFSIRGDKKWVYENDTENRGMTTYETKEDGWTYVTYEFAAKTYDGTEDIPADAWFRFDFGSRTIIVGDVLEVQGFAVNGKAYEITDANLTKYVNPTVETVVEAYEWTAHTVTFNVNGGSAIDAVEVDFGKTVAKPADPTKEGSSFAGWYADAEFTKEFDFAYPITSDVTAYAKWAAPVTLTFDSQSGSAVAAIETGAGLPIDEPEDPTRDGYMFKGWYKEAECTNEFDFEAGITEDTTVYAKWIVPKTLTLSLNYEGAAEASTIKVESGKAITEPKNPTRAGYFFGGWYKEAGCENAFDFSAGIEADTTIYAKWNAPTKSYTLTATTENDRIQLRFKQGSVDFLQNYEAGDTFAYMVKFTPVEGSSAPSRFRVRGASNYGGTSDFSSGISVSEPDANGWISVTCVFPEDADFSETGILMDMRLSSGKIAVGDVAEIKGMSFNGQEIALTSSSSCGPYEGCVPTFAENTL